MGCVNSISLKKRIKGSERSLISSSKSFQNQCYQVSQTSKEHEKTQESKISIILEEDEEKSQSENLKTSQTNTLYAINYFSSKNQKTSPFNCQENKQIENGKIMAQEIAIEKDLNDLVLVYGHKYPLNSGQLRDTQIFVPNPELQKILLEKMQKKAKIKIQGDLSVILEESETNSSFCSSHLFEEEDELIFVSISQDEGHEIKLNFQRNKSIFQT